MVVQHGEDLLEGQEDSLADALLREREGILNAELSLDEAPREPDQDPQVKKLKQNQGLASQSDCAMMDMPQVSRQSERSA